MRPEALGQARDWFAHARRALGAGARVIARDSTSKNEGPLLVGLFVLGVAVTFSRRPDAILNAQFWGEDALVWFTEAYVLGPLQALITPRDGYFQTLSRLTSAAATFGPLAMEPLVYNLVALVVQVLPAVYIASSRFAVVLQPLWARLLLALLYLAMPNTGEVHVNLTNAQWRLGIAMAIICLTPPANSRLLRGFDVTLVVLGGLSSVFGFFLLPAIVAVWRWRRDRRPWRLILGAGLSMTAAVQLAAFAFAAQTRASATDPLGASITTFIEIVGTQVALGPLIGAAGLELLYDGGITPWLSPIAAVLAMALLAAACRHGPLELRLLLLFAALTLAAGLIQPQVPVQGAGRWETLLVPRNGTRYFLIPSFALLTATVALAASRPLRVRLAGLSVIAIVILVGVPMDWKYRFEDFHFADYARTLEAAAPGTEVRIPINPAGWEMVLAKR
ncbi:MAG: hypothetical protein HW416_892 [Chloroflexi bacterium]|nr:hypothetical protein [Chloroflexota bacterium]